MKQRGARSSTEGRCRHIECRRDYCRRGHEQLPVRAGRLRKLIGVGTGMRQTTHPARVHLWRYHLMAAGNVLVPDRRGVLRVGVIVSGRPMDRRRDWNGTGGLTHIQRDWRKANRQRHQDRREGPQPHRSQYSPRKLSWAAAIPRSSQRVGSGVLMSRELHLGDPCTHPRHTNRIEVGGSYHGRTPHQRQNRRRRRERRA